VKQEFNKYLGKEPLKNGTLLQFLKILDLQVLDLYSETDEESDKKLKLRVESLLSKMDNTLSNALKNINNKKYNSSEYIKSIDLLEKEIKTNFANIDAIIAMMSSSSQETMKEGSSKYARLSDQKNSYLKELETIKKNYANPINTKQSR